MANVQHALDTSYKQYQVDIEAARNSGMNRQWQSQRIGQINASYQKKWISLKSKIEPEVEAQEARRREIIAELETDYAERITRLQQIQTMLEKDFLDPVAAKREQLRIVGFDLPLSSLNPERMANLTIGGDHSVQRDAGDRAPMVDAIGIAPDGQFYAMIAGKFVYKGDAVNGYQVQKIQEDRVEFEKDGKGWVQQVN